MASLDTLVNKNRAILIGHLPPPISGQSIAFSTLISFFEEIGYPFVIVDIAGHHENRRIGKMSFKRGMEIFKAIFLYLFYVIKRKQVIYLSIALSIVGFLRDFIFIWLAHINKHRVVLQLHGGGFDKFYESKTPLIQKIIKHTLIQADAIIVLGDYLLDQFNFLSDSDIDIKVVHNCLPKEIGESSSAPKVRNKGMPLRVLYLSNLIESKGYWDVLESIRILRLQGLDVRGDFCGDFTITSDSIRYLEKQKAKDDFLTALDQSVMRKSVFYHGVVSGDKKYDLLKKADVFLLPTYYIYEGQPISIIEALAFGIPVISTEFRGIPEMVRDGINGFLVHPNSPYEIADRLRILYMSVELYNQMSKESLSIYYELFSRNAVKKNMLKAILDGMDQTI